MSAPSSVRERIGAIQKQLRDGALTPELVRESMMDLTALLGNCTEEYRKADLLYKRVLQQCLVTHDNTAVQARIMAEGSVEYARVREAKDAQTLAVELVRSCRAYLRSLDEEMRLTR